MSRPYDLHYEGTGCIIVIGSNRFQITSSSDNTALIPMSIDGVPLLAFILQDGHLLLNVALFDEYNQLVLHVRNNQLVQSVVPWDIQFVGRRLVIREAERKILVDMTFEVPNTIRIQRARFLRNGVELLVRPEHVILTNDGAEFSGNTMTNCPTGFLIGPHDSPGPAVMSLPEVRRYSRDGSLKEAWVRECFGETPE